MAFIQTVEPQQSQGLLRQLYDAAMKRARYVAQVLRIMSPNPPVLKASMDLYLATMYGDSPLTRAQREMIAVVVSRANNCYY